MLRIAYIFVGAAGTKQADPTSACGVVALAGGALWVKVLPWQTRVWRNPEPGTRVEFELQLYYWMKLIRGFEDRVSRLHRQNKILGGVYSGAGQEGLVAGICAPLQEGDVVLPLHRDLGVFLMRGIDPGVLMAQLMGKDTGLSRGKDSFLHGGDLSRGVFGSTSMLGSSLPVAVGAALKFQIKKEKNIAVAFFGEGAASRGDVHEAMNFAGVRKLPVVFVCENNRYAYSTPLEKQMAIDDVADRAEAYGFKGHVCSGNDLLAVLDVSEPVLAKSPQRRRAGADRVQDLSLSRPQRA